MNLHSITEYIKYKWKAKNRHGIHSPFVYNFTEQVLRNKIKAPVNEKEFHAFKWMGQRYQKLLARAMKYFGFTNFLTVPPEIEEESPAYDILILKDDVPRQWVRLFNKHINILHSNGIVLVMGVHKSERHTLKWNRLCNHPKVKLSIDLYGAGILFFNDEFKEKQSFILRY